MFFRSADYGDEDYGEETGAPEEEFKISADPTSVKPETDEERNYREMIEAQKRSQIDALNANRLRAEQEVN